jgi:hypothetical protein
MPARPPTSLLALTFVLAALAGTFACDDEDDEIGTPCDSEADCSEALICDIHDGQGTCQHDHGHRSVTETPELTP